MLLNVSSMVYIFWSIRVLYEVKQRFSEFGRLFSFLIINLTPKLLSIPINSSKRKRWLKFIVQCNLSFLLTINLVLVVMRFAKLDCYIIGSMRHSHTWRYSSS